MSRSSRACKKASTWCSTRAQTSSKVSSFQTSERPQPQRDAHQGVNKLSTRGRYSQSHQPVNGDRTPPCHDELPGTEPLTKPSSCYTRCARTASAALTM